MAKFLFDGVEINFTVYPIVIIVVVLAMISVIATGMLQYKIIGSKVVRRCKERTFIIIAAIFSLVLFYTLFSTNGETQYQYFVDRGESESAAAWDSIFLLGCYSSIVGITFLCVGLLAGQIKRMALEEKLHH